MRNLSILILTISILSSCNSNKKTAESIDADNQISTAQKIANAHGFEHWKKVSEVKFTFKVDRDTIKGKGRSWIWRPKEGKVKMTMGETSIEYYKLKMDSTHIRADQAFINDKFWLLIPFQLVWDKDASISEKVCEKSPINKKVYFKITITYPEKGGYTPGDAYDIYFDESYIIREWAFRKDNAKEPSLSNTFENYKDFNGIKIAIDHKKENGNWNLNFTDVSVTLE